MKFSRNILIFVIILLSVIISSTTFASTAILNGGFLWLNPASSTTAVGATRDIVVQLDNVTEVYGADIILAFDPTIMAVVDADPQKPDVQIFPGSCPAPIQPLINVANNSVGTIEYVAYTTTTPCNGGDVATIRFECLDEGIGVITFTSHMISGPDFNEIEVMTQGADLTCGPSLGHLLYLPLILK